MGADREKWQGWEIARYACAGCTEEIEADHAVSFHDEIYCAACGGEKALEAMGDPKSDPRSIMQATFILTLVTAWRRRELLDQKKKKGEKTPHEVSN